MHSVRKRSPGQEALQRNLWVSTVGVNAPRHQGFDPRGRGASRLSLPRDAGFCSSAAGEEEAAQLACGHVESRLLRLGQVVDQRRLAARNGVKKQLHRRLAA